MVGWHHQLEGHEFEQVPGVGDGHGAQACCSPGTWTGSLGSQESDMTEQTELSNKILISKIYKELLLLAAKKSQITHFLNGKKAE